MNHKAKGNLHTTCDLSLFPPTLRSIPFALCSTECGRVAAKIYDQIDLYELLCCKDNNTQGATFYWVSEYVLRQKVYYFLSSRLRFFLAFLLRWISRDLTFTCRRHIKFFFVRCWDARERKMKQSRGNVFDIFCDCFLRVNFLNFSPSISPSPPKWTPATIINYFRPKSIASRREKLLPGRSDKFAAVQMENFIMHTAPQRSEGQDGSGILCALRFFHFVEHWVEQKALMHKCFKNASITKFMLAF